MQNWVMLGNGLPMCDVRFMFINYNENKLKIGTSRGAFEHALYEISPPSALISVGNNKISCPVAEKVQFKDYSCCNVMPVLHGNGAFGRNTLYFHIRKPIGFLCGSRMNGTYPVTLTVTDQYGTSTQTLNNFIEINNQCGTSQPDKVPRNSIKLTGQTTGDYIKIDNANLNKNSFTFSCWIKPNGIQTDYSGVFMSQDGSNPFGNEFQRWQQHYRLSRRAGAGHPVCRLL